MAGKENMAIANPVFTTAMRSVGMLAMAGNPLALDFARKLHLDTMFPMEPLTDFNHGFDVSGSHIPYIALALPVECRHCLLNLYVKRNRFTNVLELASGYTPRGIELARKGIRYVGGDIPIVSEAVAKLAEPYLRDTPGKADYVSLDVTNRSSMLKAADLCGGEMVLISSGLFSYLQQAELRALFENVREILALHGGSWITFDCAEDALQKLCARIAGCNLSLLDTFLKRYDQELSDASGLRIKVEDLETIKGLMREAGLKIEPFRMNAYGLELGTEHLMSAETNDALRRGLEELEAWKITALAESSSGSSRGSHPHQTVSPGAHMELQDGILTVSLRGRIDSMSAPDVLEVWKKTLEEAGVVDGRKSVKELHIQCEDLAYISSAGLRVLLMMLKRSSARTLRMSGVTRNVREIFYNTGFDHMMDFT